MNILNVYVTTSPVFTSTGSFVCSYTYLPSSVTVNTGTLLSICVPLTPVINFLKAKSNLGTDSSIINFSKSSSSSCPGIYLFSELISLSLYPGNSSSDGNFTLSSFESLSSTGLLFSSLSSVTSAIFVIFCVMSISFLTLHLTCTSI